MAIFLSITYRNGYIPEEQKKQFLQCPFVVMRTKDIELATGISSRAIQRQWRSTAQ